MFMVVSCPGQGVDFSVSNVCESERRDSSPASMVASLCYEIVTTEQILVNNSGQFRTRSKLDQHRLKICSRRKRDLGRLLTALDDAGLLAILAMLLVGFHNDAVAAGRNRHLSF